MTTKKNIGVLLIATITLASIITAVMIKKPITQDLLYHNFSDTKTLFNIPNFWNVISNLPFFMVGLLGVLTFNKNKLLTLKFTVFFIGVMLVALGSGYYHLQPNNSTLVWDRLPMTIAFMALFSIIISDFFNKKIGNFLFYPLLLIGLFSVLYWNFGNEHDLKYYVLVQFYPMLIIPILLVFFKNKNQQTKGYWLLLIAYIIAKLLEHFDKEIYTFLKVVGGHPIKHIVAALGIWLFIKKILLSDKSLC